MNGARADRWIRRTTIGCVGVLALIAGTVSYLHMHLLVELHGQPGWVAGLTPMSVDGMIVAASTTLLADSRSGRRGGFLPWALLVAGSAASLAANVAVAETESFLIPVLTRIAAEKRAHDLIMSVFGGVSKGERNRIKIRVRTAMAAQAQIEGRFLGGRPPYGYKLIDVGPHPNPAKGRRRKADAPARDG